MNIAIVTGASSGIGKEFVLTLKDFYKLDEVWVIARRLDRLENLSTLCPFEIKPIPLDLSDMNSLTTIQSLLEKEKPNVKVLINCSGFGKFCSTLDSGIQTNLNMVDLNCKAVMYMCESCIPYMKENARIINIASVAAMQPIPYINVYGASKAFVLSYSRALNRELKQRKITVTAVCPFWTKTEFFNRAVDDEKNKIVKKYVAMYLPSKIVKRALKDSKRKKDVSKYGFKARLQMLLTKILPHSLIMSFWLKQQKLK